MKHRNHDRGTGQTHTHISLPQELLERIDANRRSEDITRSQWLRRAARAWLGHVVKEAPAEYHVKPSTPTRSRDR